MPFTLTMPKLSPTMEAGVIAKWHKSEGDHVEAGELLLEVATDKATVEYSALDEGWLRQILIEEGQEAIVNQPIALFTVSAEESLEGYVFEKPVQKPEIPEIPAVESTPFKEKEPLNTLRGAIATPRFVPEPPLENYQFEYPTHSLDKRVKASPLARKLAKEGSLDLHSVVGSGPGGRIVSADLARAQPLNPSQTLLRKQPSIAPGTYEEEILSPIRKIIAQRLQESKTFIPHFYVRQEIDASPLVALRAQLKEFNAKMSVNDYIIRACALALKEHPEMNSGFNSENQSIIRFKTVDIAVAVSISGGLVTPIVRHADHKAVSEISVEIKALTVKAKAGKLAPEEYKGGSFTVSNLGMYGTTEFQAIINPPQAAILAVGAILEVPVIKDGVLCKGNRMNLVLSVDHRAIDGAMAAQFLKTVQKFLENPSSLLYS